MTNIATKEFSISEHKFNDSIVTEDLASILEPGKNQPFRATSIMSEPEPVKDSICLATIDLPEGVNIDESTRFF